MFTGLIQTTGILSPLADQQVKIDYESPDLPAPLGQIDVGDSVAVDGVCLTVTHLQPNGFVAAASPETLARTTLGQPQALSHVNLEASLKVGSKVGGHFVTGHIDGVGYLKAVTQIENSWEMEFTTSDMRVSRYVVSKGSIAINGVSLTVADCSRDGSRFKVAVIPLTYAETNLRHLKLGDGVNLEGDILGKYVEKFLGLAASADTSNGLGQADSSSFSAPELITPAFLAEHGYGV